MNDNKTTIVAVYQDGVFVPQADVSHLAEGSSIAIDVPAPDEWDLLLDAINAESDLAQELTKGRWDDLGSDAESWVIDSDEWLVWNLAEAREPAGILI
jgi:predicted DNA-binding antitoxin AbrB/MazE fold protein